MQTAQEKIKQQVKERYTAAVTSGGSCCGESKSCQTGSATGFVPIDRVVSVAGYSSEQLQSLPVDSIQSSFGCGNPVAFAEVKPGQMVLDIGSGAGIDCLLAAEKVGPLGKVIGIDMTPVMIQKARKNAEQAGFDNVEFRQGDAENMPVETGTIDWVISNCVINLSPDKESVFNEAFRVLRPGGKLSISDIMVEKLPWFLRRSAVLHTSCVAGAIPEKQYLEALRLAGFSDVRTTERIVYDCEQVAGLMEGIGLFKKLRRMFPKLMNLFLNRYVDGKIWSSRIHAEKPE